MEYISWLRKILFGEMKTYFPLIFILEVEQKYASGFLFVSVLLKIPLSTALFQTWKHYSVYSTPLFLKLGLAFSWVKFQIIKTGKPFTQCFPLHSNLNKQAPFLCKELPIKQITQRFVLKRWFPSFFSSFKKKNPSIDFFNESFVLPLQWLVNFFICGKARGAGLDPWTPRQAKQENNKE